MILLLRSGEGVDMVLPIEEVKSFLSELYEILDTGKEERCIINDAKWVGDRVNKTRKYMTETGIMLADIIAVVKELGVDNYSSTKDDRNINFPNEKVWEFGITKNIVDKEEDYYIKLKIRKFEEDYLLIMSFHPEEPTKLEDKLKFPYKEKN